MKPKYYSLENIKKRNAQYNLIFGQRSDGKTWQVLTEILKNYHDHGKQGALIRRYAEDITPFRMSSIFNDIVSKGFVSDLYFNDGIKGKHWNGIRYYRRCFFLTATWKDKEGEEHIENDTKPFMYVFCLSEEERNKETQYPDVTTIFFDEFLSRKGYLEDEFILFCNTISTIKRERQDVTIYRCGNTINKYCPYFTEMGLKHISDIPRGKIELYTYGDSPLKVAVEYADNLNKLNGRKDIDKYFAFDNPKLKMITSGEWELDIYPHLPFKYLPKDVKLVYFIKFDDHIYQCEIIKHGKDYITYIHNKTTPIKKDTDIVFTTEPNYSRFVYNNILRPVNNLTKTIAYFYLTGKVFYQDNEVGDTIHNYLITLNGIIK